MRSYLAIVFFVLVSLFVGTPSAHAFTVSKASAGNTLGLVGWWTMDGTDMLTGLVRDKSGRANHGTQTNMASSTARMGGPLGQALHFDGVDDYLALGSASTLDDLELQGGGGMSLSLWIKPDVSGSNNVIIAKGNGASFTGCWELGFTVGTRVSFTKEGGTDMTARIGINAYTVGVWQHFALVWDGSGTAANVHFYVNGVEKSHDLNSDGASFTSDAALNLVVGARSNGTLPMQSGVDDVRIYNRQLTTSEITALYNAGLGNKQGDTKPSGGPINTGLIGYWSFDGADTLTGLVRDVSGNGRHASYVSLATSTARAAGIIGQAVQFPGTGSGYVNTALPVSTSTTFSASSDFTIAFWAFPNTAGNQRFYSAMQSGNTRFYFGPQTPTGNGTVILGLGSWNPTVTSAVTAKVWQHYAVTLSGTTGTLYRNGSSIASQSGITLAYPGNALRIGLDNDGLNPTDGRIDDFRLYNRALTAAEVLQLYAMGQGTIASIPTRKNAAGSNGLVAHWTFDGKDMLTGLVRDISGNANHGSQVNMATSSARVQGKVGQALSFDGVDDYVKTASTVSFGSNVATVSFWMNIPSYANDNAMALELSSNSTNAGNDGAFFIDPNDSGGVFSVALQDSVSTASFRKETFTRPSAGVWHHYAFIIDNSTATGDLRAFVDGVEQSTSITLNTKDQSSNIKTDTFYFMSRAGSVLFKSGALDDVRIYNRALSAAEILQLCNQGR